MPPFRSVHAARIGFEDVAARAGLDQVLCEVIDLVDGEDQDLRWRHSGADLTCRFEAVHLGHPHVEDDDVGTELRRLGHRFAPVGRFGADPPAFMSREQRTNALSNDVVIIGDEDLNQWNAFPTGHGPPRATECLGGSPLILRTVREISTTAT
jgi:hypothetical protein